MAGASFFRPDRRGFLGLLGAGAAGPALAKQGSASGDAAFAHGVASGDPRADGVILWTRVTPADAAAVIAVDWRVRDADGATVAEGQVEASRERDHTVKVDVRGLRPGVEYRYDFAVGETRSAEGRTRTLPEGAVKDVVLAVASCALHPGGLFNAYEAIGAMERVDAVIHLGDYIYEYGADDGSYGMATGRQLNRVPDPAHDIVSLEDYRRRHAQYKSDADLQAAHARAAFICVWDDHEVANDSWLSGAENHRSDQGDFAARKAVALRAYYEWMPIREPEAGLAPEAINRAFHFGGLASLLMVETRLTARDEPIGYGDLTVAAGSDGQPVPDVAAFETLRNDPARRLLGEAQEAWIGRELAASKAAGRPWQIIGNQVVMARVAGPDITRMVPEAQLSMLLASLSLEMRAQVEQSIPLFRLGLPFNLDAWDGYPAARERLYSVFREAGVRPIVLAGDSHAFWANQLSDAGGELRAVEFGTTSVSSPSIGDLSPALPLGAALAMTNDEVVFCDQTAKGFTILTLTPAGARAELRKVSTIFSKPFTTETVATFEVPLEAEGAGALRQV